MSQISMFQPRSTNYMDRVKNVSVLVELHEKNIGGRPLSEVERLRREDQAKLDDRESTWEYL